MNLKKKNNQNPVKIADFPIKAHYWASHNFFGDYAPKGVLTTYEQDPKILSTLYYCHYQYTWYVNKGFARNRFQCLHMWLYPSVDKKYAQQKTLV